MERNGDQPRSATVAVVPTISGRTGRVGTYGSRCRRRGDGDGGRPPTRASVCRGSPSAVRARACSCRSPRPWGSAPCSSTAPPVSSPPPGAAGSGGPGRRGHRAERGGGPRGPGPSRRHRFRRRRRPGRRLRLRQRAGAAPVGLPRPAVPLARPFRAPRRGLRRGLPLPRGPVGPQPAVNPAPGGPVTELCRPRRTDIGARDPSPAAAVEGRRPHRVLGERASTAREPGPDHLRKPSVGDSLPARRRPEPGSPPSRARNGTRRTALNGRFRRAGEKPGNGGMPFGPRRMSAGTRKGRGPGERSSDVEDVLGFTSRSPRKARGTWWSALRSAVP